MNKYLLKPALKTFKEGYSLSDESGNIVYEAKMLKFKLFTASPFTFTNYITNKKEEHQIGKTVTLEEPGIVGLFSTKSYFKYDGKKIWNYLEDMGIRINSTPSTNKLGMSYEVSLKGEYLVTISTSSPKGKSLITTTMYYDITCEEKDIDLAFLVVFAIAKTNQVFYS